MQNWSYLLEYTKYRTLHSVFSRSWSRQCCQSGTYVLRCFPINILKYQHFAQLRPMPLPLYTNIILNKYINRLSLLRCICTDTSQDILLKKHLKLTVNSLNTCAFTDGCTEIQLKHGAAETLSLHIYLYVSVVRANLTESHSGLKTTKPTWEQGKQHCFKY